VYLYNRIFNSHFIFIL